LDSVPNLRTLDLSFNRITKIDGWVPAGAGCKGQQCTGWLEWHMQCLDLLLSKCVSRLSSLSKLKELKLYDNRISVLQNLSALTALHTLDISSNRLQSLEVSRR
jgi:Leucine-rich repeat (LRR) protein